MTDKINGLILLGGKSKRMGQPKAYLDFGQGPQWLRCEHLLKPFVSSVYFSVSPHLFPALPLEKTRLVEDIFAEPFGPLGGILSAFKKHSGNALFVLACDLPHFDERAVSYLIEKRNPSKKATVYINNGALEPLCALYEASILEDLAYAWAQGNYCPRKILSELDVEYIEPQDKNILTNINHSYEFEKMIEKTKPSKSVVIYYYALLKDQAKCQHERTTTSVTTIGELFLEMKQKYSFSLEQHSLRFAKNDQLVDEHELLSDNDEIVFLPPVSGG